MPSPDNHLNKRCNACQRLDFLLRQLGQQMYLSPHGALVANVSCTIAGIVALCMDSDAGCSQCWRMCYTLAPEMEGVVGSCVDLLRQQGLPEDELAIIEAGYADQIANLRKWIEEAEKLYPGETPRSFFSVN